MSDKEKGNFFEKTFVESTIERLKNDTALAAKLKRADNDATEYEAWSYLTGWNIDIEKSYERKAFCLVVAAIARNKVTHNGSYNIGKVLALCINDADKENSPVHKKLLRLLACSSVDEACSVLRPILAYIGSKGEADKLDYGGLLRDISSIGGKYTKIRWAKSFYGKGGGYGEDGSDNA